MSGTTKKRKKLKQAPLTPEAEEAAPPPQKLSPYGEWWDEDPRREQCFDLIVQGLSKRAVATRLGVHRNTVNNWCDSVEFKKLEEQYHNDRVGALRTRRAQQTMVMTDRVAALTEKVIQRAESAAATTGLTVGDRQALRDMVSTFKDLRAEERIDTGDNVARHNHNHNVSGGLIHGHASVRAESFKDFVQKQLDAKVIDISALEEATQDPVVALVQRVLIDTPLLDDIAAEDEKERGVL